MVNIQFYKYTGREATVNKTLSDPVEMTGLLRDKQNVSTPVIKLRNTQALFDFNYCYIAELNRYYNIIDFAVMDVDTVEIRLKIDVLKTYAEQILNATGTVYESQNGNRFLSNRRQLFDVRPKTELLQFPETDLFDTRGKIIMVTLDGKIE